MNPFDPDVPSPTKTPINELGGSVNGGKSRTFNYTHDINDPECVNKQYPSAYDEMCYERFKEEFTNYPKGNDQMGYDEATPEPTPE